MSDDLHLNPFHARLVELETAFAFQQKLVEELHDGLLAQSRSLQRLEKQIRALQEQLAAQSPANSAAESAAETVEDMSE